MAAHQEYRRINSCPKPSAINSRCGGEINHRSAILVVSKWVRGSHTFHNQNRLFRRRPALTEPCVLIAESFPQQLETNSNERDPEKRDFGYYLSNGNKLFPDS